MATVNKWHLSDKEKAEWLPKIKAWIETNHDNGDDEPELDLYRTVLSPYTLKDILIELGYSDDYEQDTNGWEQDLWLIFKQKDGEQFKLTIDSTGMTFELRLRKTY